MSTSELDFRIVLLILAVSLCILLFFFKLAKKWNEKLLLVFLLSGTTFYSGIGIAQNIVDKRYIPLFFLFLLFEGGGTLLGFKLFKKESEPYDKVVDTLVNSQRFLNIMAVLYWLIIFILLVYPTNHLNDIFSVKIDISGVFENKVAKRSNTFTYVLGLTSTILLIFYCMFLSTKSKWCIIFLLLLEDYFFAVTNSYIGRTEIMMLLVRIIIIYFIKDVSNFKNHDDLLNKENNEENDKKTNTAYLRRLRMCLLVMVIGFLLMTPFLVSYQFSRKGQVYVAEGFSDFIVFLLGNETFYPMLYEYAELFYGQAMTPLNYLYWFATLPIPKEIISLPHAVVLNNAFSELYTGISFGEQGFTILLVSLLGEGIMLWGKFMCIIHGFFVGLIWGMLFSFVSRYKSLVVFQVFFITKTLNMVRGGSQGSISYMVNCIVPFIVISTVIYYLFFKNASKEIQIDPKKSIS